VVVIVRRPPALPAGLTSRARTTRSRVLAFDFVHARAMSMARSMTAPDDAMNTLAMKMSVNRRDK